MRERDGALPIILRKTTILILIGLLVLALMSIIFLGQDIHGKLDTFVQKTIENAKETLQSNDTEKDSHLSLQIAQDFGAAFEEMRFRTFIYELLIHLTIAGIVALILIFFIERQIRSFNQKELDELKKANQNRLDEFRKIVADDVWKAVCNRLVPKEVTAQIEGILQFDFIKRHVHYTITLDKLPGEISNKKQGDDENRLILLKRELRFTVENISRKDAAYNFYSTVLTTADKIMDIDIHSDIHGFPIGERLTFPRHEFLSIRGKEEDIDGHENLMLKYPIDLTSQECCEICHTVFEILSINDEAYYVQTVPIIGLDVEVSNLIPQRITIDNNVYLSHPERKDLLQRPAHGHSQRWVFEGKAILPGQIFSIQWKANSNS